VKRVAVAGFGIMRSQPVAAEAGSPGSAAAVFAQCLLQICLKRSEPLAFGRRQV
jgi:hypothetical protein